MTWSSDGRLTLDLEPGRRYRVRALEVGLGARSTDLQLERSLSGRQSVQLAMRGELLREDAALRIEQARDGVLDVGFAELRAGFTRVNGAQVRLAHLRHVFLLPVGDSDASVRVTQMFHLGSDGRLELRDVEAFRSALRELGTLDVALDAYAIDAGGMVYAGVHEFRLGGGRVHGTLLAPPSNPALPLGGIEVIARFLDQERSEMRTRTAADGSFELEGIPLGGWAIDATITDGGQTYAARAMLDATGEMALEAPLLGIRDVQNEVQPYSARSLDAPAVQPPAPAPERETRSDAGAEASDEALAAVPGLAIAIVETLENPPGTPMTVTKVMVVPQGTRQIYLRSIGRSREFSSPEPFSNDRGSYRLMTEGGVELARGDTSINALAYDYDRPSEVQVAPSAP